MKTSDKARLPGAMGSGLFRGQSAKSHNWSGDWHLRPRKKPGGPAESFATELRGTVPGKPRRETWPEA